MSSIEVSTTWKFAGEFWAMVTGVAAPIPTAAIKLPNRADFHCAIFPLLVISPTYKIERDVTSPVSSAYALYAPQTSGRGPEISAHPSRSTGHSAHPEALRDSAVYRSANRRRALEYFFSASSIAAR